MSASTIIFFALIAVGPIIGIWTAFRQRRGESAVPTEQKFGPNVVALSSVAAANSGFIMIAAVAMATSPASAPCGCLWPGFSATACIGMCSRRD